MLPIMIPLPAVRSRSNSGEFVELDQSMTGLFCMQLDLAKLVPSGREQGLEDKLRGLQE